LYSRGNPANARQLGGIAMIEFTVSTFNGLTIKGIGYTILEAKAEARQKCEAMGTLPKHIVSILEI
jgi:hypothetical protein